MSEFTNICPWEIFRNSEIFLLYVQFFSNFLPFSRSECLFDVLRHVGENESVHDEVVVSLVLALYSGQLGHDDGPDV